MGTAALNRQLKKQIKQGNYPTCYLCKEPITRESELSHDHLLPKSLNGTASQKNLMPAHKICNSRRGITPLSMIACGCWRSGWHFKTRQ
ncbi:MAG: HNH endonuclease [Methanobrevibacter sp.]|nr:HNH endonuclease [Methanobrevibacter sp.]